MGCVDFQCEDKTNDGYNACDNARRTCESEYNCYEIRDCFDSVENFAKCALGLFCEVGEWVADSACELYEATKNAACKAAVTAFKFSCDLSQAFINAVCDIGNFLFAVAQCILSSFRSPIPLTEVDDHIPDFNGVNFIAKDESGNTIPFLWGVSTASQQHEGNIRNSDWDIFTSSTSVKFRVEALGSAAGTDFSIERPGQAVGHRVFNSSSGQRIIPVLEEDIDRAILIGLNTYRFSIEWMRLQPTAPDWINSYKKNGRTNGYQPTEFSDQAMSDYRLIVNKIKSKGLKIILTINHMSLPNWVLTPPTGVLVSEHDQGFQASLRGWENSIVIEAYTNLVQHVVTEFANDIDYWITLNEPIATQMQLGYIAGIFPPGFLADGARAKTVYFNLIKAHVSAYETIKRIVGQNAKIGFSQYVAYPASAPQTCIEKHIVGDNNAAASQWEYAINRYFLDAVVNGDYNESLLLNGNIQTLQTWINKIDFIAIQYYRSFDIYHDHLLTPIPWIRGNFHADARGGPDYLNKEKLFNDLGWTIYPGGLYQILKDFHDRYNLPILITENGICQSEDRNRAAYTIAHLQQVLKAIKNGVNVLGYVHWSIVDNFEWAYGYKIESRFGLFTVNRKEGIPSGSYSFRRHITEGALALQYLIAKSAQISQQNNNEDPFELVVKRFGTIDPKGVQVQPPTLTFGGLWELKILNETVPLFNLYLTPLSNTINSNTVWLGMLFDLINSKWIRLKNIRWRSINGDETFSNGLLTFNHPSIQDSTLEVQYRLITFTFQAFYQLKGKIVINNREIQIVGKRNRKVGTWRKNFNEPDKIPIVTLHNLEGENDEWHGKYLNDKPEWVAFAINNDSQFTVVQNQSGPDRINGSIPVNYGGINISFQGVKLPDYVPF